MATQEKQKRGIFKSLLYNKYTHKPKTTISPKPVVVVEEEKEQPPCAVVEGRRSVSHVEANLGSSIAFLQVRVLVSDMSPLMQAHAFRCARRTYACLDKFSSKHIAFSIKKEFDKVYGPAWHCIVGSSFGSYVTHATGCFLYFSIDKLYVLLFKTKVQKALHSPK